jgi:50S ribosomal protein L16 3-hydroxylase
MLNFPGDLSAEDFVDNFWQKQPLAMAQALPQAMNVIDKDSLLELSCSDEVESRLITHFDGVYELIDGPQSEPELERLKAKDHWTLLVQSVNLWHAKVASLVPEFDFIPHWRFDDIMISFATDQAGVGPHIDQYDVFLVQLSGRRQWRVGQPNMAVQAIETGCGLKQIAPFKADLDQIFEPGDVLYVPPCTPHEGISIGQSVTLSVGFRSPSVSEFSMMLGEVLHDQSIHYRDPEKLRSESPYQIPASALEQVNQWFVEALEPGAIHIAFAKLQTQPKQELLLEPVEDALAWLLSGNKLLVDPAARIAWFIKHDELLLFANGEDIHLPADEKHMVDEISRCDQIDLNTISAYIGNDSCNRVIQFLSDVGYLGITE